MNKLQLCYCLPPWPYYRVTIGIFSYSYSYSFTLHLIHKCEESGFPTNAFNKPTKPPLSHTIEEKHTYLLFTWETVFSWSFSQKCIFSRERGNNQVRKLWSNVSFFFVQKWTARDFQIYCILHVTSLCLNVHSPEHIEPLIVPTALTRTR